MNPSKETLMCVCVCQTWMSVMQEPHAVSRTAPTIRGVMSATAGLVTVSTLMDVAVMVWSCITNLWSLLQLNVWHVFIIGTHTEHSSTRSSVFLFLHRCGRVSGGQWRLWAHLPKHSWIFPVLLSSRTPSWRGQNVLCLYVKFSSNWNSSSGSIKCLFWCLVISSVVLSSLQPCRRQ